MSNIFRLSRHVTRVLVQASYDYRAAFRFTYSIVLAVGVEENFSLIEDFKKEDSLMSVVSGGETDSTLLISVSLFLSPIWSACIHLAATAVHLSLCCSFNCVCSDVRDYASCHLIRLRNN